MTTIVNLNEGNFEDEVLKSSVPCVVDFWAEYVALAKISPQYWKKFQLN